jgi:hypothetical protein
VDRDGQALDALGGQVRGRIGQVEGEDGPPRSRARARPCASTFGQRDDGAHDNHNDRPWGNLRKADFARGLDVLR